MNWIFSALLPVSFEIVAATGFAHAGRERVTLYLILYPIARGASRPAIAIVAFGVGGRRKTAIAARSASRPNVFAELKARGHGPTKTTKAKQRKKP